MNKLLVLHIKQAKEQDFPMSREENAEFSDATAWLTEMEEAKITWENNIKTLKELKEPQC